MPKLLGKEYTKEDILRYSGNLNQICGITEGRFSDGKADNVGNYTVKTGSGLEYTVLSGKCLDISSLSYRGINISYLAKPGIVAPQYGYRVEKEFLNYITGGMLYTCGLLNVGPSCTDKDGIYHPFHGRIGITPAEHPYAKCYWEKDEYILETGGLMREAALFNHNLTLTRKIVSKLGESKIEISDVLENNSPEAEEFMILYHMNFGFPFLDEGVKLIFPENKVVSNDNHSQKNIKESDVITKPQDGISEQVFFRDVKEDKDGFVTVKIENKKLGIGVYIKYEKKNLPNLTEWKSMGSGDYVLGIEPCNNFVKGRKAERENGTLNSIKPFSKISYNIKIGCYDL